MPEFVNDLNADKLHAPLSWCRKLLTQGRIIRAPNFWDCLGSVKRELTVTDITNISIIGNTLKVLNQMEADGVIGRYAIGGGIGFFYYVEPSFTDDLDVFVHLPKTSILYSVAPIYDHLKKLGYDKCNKERILVEGIPVQFLQPHTQLTEEAMKHLVDITVEGVPSRVLSYEYLIATKVEAGRGKDKARVATAVESRQPNEGVLKDILMRYSLLDKYARIVE